MPEDPIVDEVRRVRQVCQRRFRCQGNPCRLEKATTPVQAQGRIICAKKEVERLTG